MFKSCVLRAYVCVRVSVLGLCGRASMGPSDGSRGGSRHGNRGSRRLSQHLSCPRILQTSQCILLIMTHLRCLPPAPLFFFWYQKHLLSPLPPLLSLPPSVTTPFLYTSLSPSAAPFPCIPQSSPTPPSSPSSASVAVTDINRGNKFQSGGQGVNLCERMCVCVLLH